VCVEVLVMCSVSMFVFVVFVWFMCLDCVCLFVVYLLYRTPKICFASKRSVCDSLVCILFFKVRCICCDAVCIMSEVFHH